MTHAAIDYYNQMANAYRNAAAAFEAQFGTFDSFPNTDAAYWSWINDPWPWEGGGAISGIYEKRDWNFQLNIKEPNAQMASAYNESVWWAGRRNGRIHALSFPAHTCHIKSVR